MATPLAGASVDRGVEVELRMVIESRGASGDCHPRLVELSRCAAEVFVKAIYVIAEVQGDGGL